MDYKSDDNIDYDNIEDDNIEDDNIEDNEENIQIKELIYKSINNFNNLNLNDLKDNKNNDKLKNKKKNNKILSLEKFITKSDEPIKFVSQRVADKKKYVEVKRTFNPRLPPYNIIKYKKNEILKINLDIDNFDLFPKL